MSDKRILGPAKYFPTTNPVGVTNPPLAVWQFDPCGLWLDDRTANGRDLTVVTGSFEFKPDEDMGLIGIVFDTGQDHELIAPAEEALRVAQNELGTDDASLTIEAIVRQDTGTGGIILGCDASGESLVSNYLWQFGPVWNDGGVLKYYSFAERGGGTNINVNSNAIASYGSLIYLALTISSDGLTWKYYVNGVLIGQAVIANCSQKNSAGGNNQRVRIGRQENDTNEFRGLLCGLKMTNETFDDADIVDVWDSIKGYSLPIEERGFEVQAEESVVFPPLTGDVVRGSMGIERARVIGVGARVSADEEIEFQTQGGDAHGPLALGHGRDVDAGQASADESIDIDISGPAEFSLWSTDEDGKPHFATPTDYPHPIRAFYYSTIGEPWQNPAGSGLTGYARNGKRYTGGVEDAGPVWAPWATEASSADRGVRDDFPVTSLIVVARNEVVIFDLDDFDGTVPKLRVFMRFRFGDSSNFYMAGRGNYTIRDVKMVNGVLVLVQQTTPWEIGRLILIDFKGDTTSNTGHLIGSDNHWRWNGTIADRNTVKYTTSGVSPSLRHNCENIYSCSAFLDDDQTLYVGIVGDDTSPTVFKSYVGTGLNMSSWVSTVTGPEIGSADQGEDYRQILFDRLGILWFSIDNRLYRNMGQYKEGAIVADIAGNWQPDALYKGVELPEEIYGLAEAQNFIFCAGDSGVWAVHRGSLDFWLAYTWAGGGGRGTANSPGAGEILIGEPNRISRKRLYSLSLAQANFIAILQDLHSGPGKQVAMLVRTSDDYLVSSLEWPTEIVEPSAAFHVLIT